MNVASLNELRIEVLKAAIDANRMGAPDSLQNELRDHLDALARASRADLTPLLIVHHTRATLDAWADWIVAASFTICVADDGVKPDVVER